MKTQTALLIGAAAIGIWWFSKNRQQPVDVNLVAARAAEIMQQTNGGQTPTTIDSLIADLNPKERVTLANQLIAQQNPQIQAAVAVSPGSPQVAAMAATLDDLLQQIAGGASGTVSHDAVEAQDMTNAAHLQGRRIRRRW